jgi:hypothetical protein
MAIVVELTPLRLASTVQSAAVVHEDHPFAQALTVAWPAVPGEAVLAVVVTSHVWLPVTRPGTYVVVVPAPLPNDPAASIPQHFIDASSRMAQAWRA